MIDLFLFLAFVFAGTLILGRLLEKIHVPWIFGALLLGSFFAVYKVPVIESPEFQFLANLGMYFLLFMIGLEIDLKEFKNKGKYFIESTFFIICFEAVFGTLIVHYIFGYAWLTSILVALSFATVGEAILIPILDEFNAINTDLGQMIIGIGSLDDIIEVFTLIWAVFMIGSGNVNFVLTFLAIGSLFALTGLLMFIRKKERRFKFKNIEVVFLVSLAILFLFIGIGDIADTASLAALLAGIGIKTFLPKQRLEKIESEIKTITYGFFAPAFFIAVGAEMNIDYLLSAPLLIILVVVVSDLAKIIASYISAKKVLGTKKSILLGIGLSVRFSTSIIIIKMLLDGGIIDYKLYSVIVASSIVFKFIIPVLFSNLLVRWNIGRAEQQRS